MKTKGVIVSVSFGIILFVAVGCGIVKNEMKEATVVSEKQESKQPAKSGETKTKDNKSEEVIFPDHIISALNNTGYTEADVTGNQLIVVTADGITSELNCYEIKNHSLELIDQLSSIPAGVGNAGVGFKEHEGDGVSPEGLWDIGFAFGRKENPGTSLEYKQVTEQSYWVDDPNSIHYNRWVENDPDGSWTSAEHLNDFEAYNYGLVIEYNYENPVRGAGSAIFLHCGNSWTFGCISVPEENMKQILQWVQDDAMILIVGAH